VGEHGPFLQAGGVLRFKSAPSEDDTPATSAGPGERRNGTGMESRVHFTYAPDAQKSLQAEV